MPRLTMRRMLESDVGDVVVTERLAYAFPWSEGIFRDCLRAGYICRVAELDHLFVGYGILSVGAGEAHVLNVCVAPEHQGHGPLLLVPGLVGHRLGGGQGVAGDARLVVDDGNASLSEPVKQTALADIGSADDGDSA